MPVIGDYTTDPPGRVPSALPAAGLGARLGCGGAAEQGDAQCSVVAAIMAQAGRMVSGSKTHRPANGQFGVPQRVPREGGRRREQGLVRLRVGFSIPPQSQSSEDGPISSYRSVRFRS